MDIAIRTDSLSKHFGDLVAVQNLSLEIYRGEILGFLGPNGAGKTTSIQMICGLLTPTSGMVFINNQQLRNGNDVRHQIGVCPQENIFWSKLTCLEQLIFMGEMYNLTYEDARRRGKELLDLLGLQQKSSTLAHKLSGGMKRRLNICLALIHDPAILIFDEPEAGLDPQSRVLVREIIRSLAEKKTVILTTHNMDEADRLADRVAIIDHGALLQLDTPEQLKRSIGEGDILEIELSTENPQSIAAAMETLNRQCDSMKYSEPVLIMKSPDLITKIPAITGVLQQHHVQAKEMRIRENSLEDVFIHLTGKTLRQ